MNLYAISQSINNGYDTFSDAVVAAENEADARLIHPSGRAWSEHIRHDYDDWAKSEDVVVELIGVAVDGTPAGVICASFHAG